jgi:hypothetical protein
MSQILIGIDVGANKSTGTTVYNPKTKEILYIKTSTRKDAIKALKAFVQNENDEVIIVIENSNLDSATFDVWPIYFNLIKRWRAGEKEATNKKIEKEFRSWQSKAQSVGKNKQATKDFVKELEPLNLKIVEIAPSERNRADKIKSIGKIKMPIGSLHLPTKASKEQFAKLTGYTKSTSDHARDSATLVYNKTFFYYQNRYREQQRRRKQLEAAKLELKEYKKQLAALPAGSIKEQEQLRNRIKLIEKQIRKLR